MRSNSWHAGVFFQEGGRLTICVERVCEAHRPRPLDRVQDHHFRSALYHTKGPCSTAVELCLFWENQGKRDTSEGNNFYLQSARH